MDPISMEEDWCKLVCWCVCVIPVWHFKNKSCNADIKKHESTQTHSHMHAHAPLSVCSVDTHIVVSSGPAWVELHVELPFLAG